MSQIPLPSNLCFYKRVAGVDQAAGVEITDAVPAGKSWWLMGVSVQLVQGITQTPLPNLVIDDGANILFELPGMSSALNASVTAQCSWGPNLLISGGGALTVATGPLPEPLILGPGFRIRTITTGIGANTNYGVPSYYVIEIG